MFSDTPLSETITGYNRGAKVKELHDIASNMLLNAAKNIDPSYNSMNFLSYVDSVFNFILAEHGIAEEELDIDLNEIFMHMGENRVHKEDRLPLKIENYFRQYTSIF